MKYLCSILLLALTACAPALAQNAPSEVLFVGELRSMTLTLRDHEAEQRALDEERRILEQRGEADSQTIIVSNSCGTASTSFRVLHANMPIAREVQTNYELGEWCEPPVGFARGPWLIVIDAETIELLAGYEIVEQGGAPYALLLDVENEFARRSPEVRHALTLAPLPEPIEYRTEGFVPNEALARWVATRPALEIRDEKVWIVRAVPVRRAFPEFAFE